MKVKVKVDEGSDWGGEVHRPIKMKEFFIQSNLIKMKELLSNQI